MFKKLILPLIITSVVVILSACSIKQVSSTNILPKLKSSDFFNTVKAIPITNIQTELNKSDGHNYQNNKLLILGSVNYVEEIQNISKISGNQNAFSAIMIDVDKNGNELVYNDPNNISRFKSLVSSLICKIGYVDMQVHYFKNKLNRAPNTLKELIDINKTVPVNKRWILLSVAGSGYHMQGVNGEYNLKFESYDYYDEAVYNKKGILLNENNNPINMGSYNYGVSSRKAHIRFDQLPYLIWGNAANSPQKGKDAINKGVKLGIINYKKHAASVYLYRQNLFGMQQGRVK